MKYLFLLTIIFSIISCDSTEPPIDDLQPGSRDYTWEADTLIIPFTYLTAIWGNSSDDVWAVGPGGDKDKTIYHYDGNQWSNDGISRPIAPNTIWGFDSDDIWIAGNNGIFHYDGADWYESFEYVDSNITYSYIYNLWGDSPDNVWATGFIDSSNVRKAILFNYNGRLWERTAIQDESIDFIQIKRGKKSSLNYMIFGIVVNNIGPDTNKIFEFDGKQLNEIKTDHLNSHRWKYIQEINDKLVIGLGANLYNYDERNFQFITQNPYNNFMNLVVGRNSNDIFWPLKNAISHYNGSNIKVLYNFSNDIRIVDGLIFKNKVFFLGIDTTSGFNIILRGTLNN